MSAITDLLANFETQYGRMPKGYRRKLDAILARDPKGRNSGLTLLALKAFPSSPLQKLLQNLRALD